MTGFSISELPLTTGMLALCPLPRDASDVARVAAWGADMVLTLVEPKELATLGVAHLPDWIVDAGIAWRHYPIVDYGTPSADWSPLSGELHGVLATGGRIMIHCRGGCGRTGMIALRLMEEAGEANALARLRAARPCAIETDAQMDWALRAVP